MRELRFSSKKTFCSFYNLPIFALSKAKIAQLVEHNLAKVGVASSNLVFRST
ncbi:hypothetical protein BN1088_1430655 [Sphingobacterium sp. PM2-P1-29]|nr:hypothetical protein BN1088_1430655 [Sphingobacterium sp. PM2-P1-29]